MIEVGDLDILALALFSLLPSGRSESELELSTQKVRSIRRGTGRT